MKNLVELHDISKRFGEKQVLDHLTMVVPEGSIYGFVGENGAGKTTTMRLILGLERMDDGTISFKDAPAADLHPESFPTIGYLPDVPTFYDDMTPMEYLTLAGQLAGMHGVALANRCQAQLKLVGLPIDRRRIHGFSRGMKQRLGIAQALLTKPQLLICDEPTSALDPSGRNDFLALLASLRHDMTIIFSTHILSDVERVADHVGIQNGGQLQAEGSLVELRRRYAQPRIAVQMMDGPAAMRACTVLEIPCKAVGSRVDVPYAGKAAAAMKKVMQALAAADLIPVAITQQATTLDDIFMEVVK
jgi:ABC-2 type transport system ATP-binding protein